MKLIPFDRDKEMVAIAERPGRHGAPSRTIWNAPISGPDNIRDAFRTKQIQYFPNFGDMKLMQTRVIPDNMARGAVRDGLEPFVPPAEGMKDAFGVEWVFEPHAGGAMEKPGVPPLLDNINKWKEIIVFPNPDSWKWDDAKIANKEYLSDPMYLNKSTIFTGYFERLISWLGFENAIVALFDEEFTDAVHEVFDCLTEYYMHIISHMKEAFDVELIEFHDDWGGQNAPLFSVDVHQEMILPYLKRVVNHVHSLGMFFEMHSCGKCESFVPAMIEAGVDTWMGQDCNDKKMLFDAYGDKLLMQVEVPELGLEATDEEIWVAAEQFCKDYVVQGKPAAMGLYSNARSNRPLMQDAIYQMSRVMLCGEK